jgi:hypothetical protein
MNESALGARARVAPKEDEALAAAYAEIAKVWPGAWIAQEHQESEEELPAVSTGNGSFV